VIAWKHISDSEDGAQYWATDRGFVVSATSQVQLTLSSADDSKGQEVVVFKGDGNAQTSIVEASGSDTINGTSFCQTTTQYAVIRLASDGEDWVILENTDWSS
jgi:hypothetical protein